jgi:shikimate dehydrogenase
VIRLGLAGRGISGSPSPAVQEALLRAARLEGSYELFDVDRFGLARLLARLRGGGLSGINVTMPYKQTVAAACDVLEGEGRLLAAVNTVAVQGTALHGSNTDVRGFERALRLLGLHPPQGSHAMVLGAGGAAAAVCLALGRLGVARISLVARRPALAVALAERLDASPTAAVLPWEARSVAPALGSLSIVVNATPVGLPLLPLHPRALPASCTVADVRYRPPPVDLVVAAEQTGHRAADGREMLLQQAVLSFTRWTGAVPEEAPAREALDAALR